MTVYWPNLPLPSREADHAPGKDDDWKKKQQEEEEKRRKHEEEKSKSRAKGTRERLIG